MTKPTQLRNHPHRGPQIRWSAARDLLNVSQEIKTANEGIIKVKLCKWGYGLKVTEIERHYN